MKKQNTISLEAVYIYIYIYTGSLLNESKLYNREYNNLFENEGLLSKQKKYKLKRDSSAIFVSILDTG